MDTIAFRFTTYEGRTAMHGQWQFGTVAQFLEQCAQYAERGIAFAVSFSG